MSRIFIVRFWSQTEPEWDRGDVPWIIRMAVRWGIVMLGFLAAREVVNWLYGEDRIIIDSWKSLLTATAIFVAVRAVVRPVLVLLTCPLQLLTLGLFMLVVNAAVLGLTDRVCDWWDVNFEVDWFWPALIGSAVISLVSFGCSRLLRWNPFAERRV